MDNSFEQNSSFTPTPDVVEYKSFEKMEIKDEHGNETYIPDDLLRGIYGYGWGSPSQIQQKGIVPIMSGRDVILQAQSGTGKTGTYSIGSLSRVNPQLKELQVLIILNTKNLANQVISVINSLSINMGITVKKFMGAVEISEDIRNIKNGCQVAVGTPGRICDLLNRNIMKLTNLRTLIIDEADCLLQKGFRDNIEQICKNLPKTNCNIAVISATMPDSILQITNLFMIEPIKVLVKKENVQADGILQFYLKLKNDEWKFATLLDFFNKIQATMTLIFINSSARCQKLTDDLRARGLPVNCIYGKMTNEEQDKILQEFRDGTSRILVATDVLCRGIDIQTLRLVINFDIPMLHDRENYIHRIGRTGRFAKRGCAISFVTPEDEHNFNEISKDFSLKINPLPKDFIKFV